MKSIFAKSLFICFCFIYTGSSFAQITKESFSILNLKQHGLEKVVKAVEKGKYQDAAGLLLKYYRQRIDFKNLASHIDASHFKRIKVTSEVQKLADNILTHNFKPHKGYPSYFYGEEINWQYNPVEDHIFSNFLHRTVFWESLGTVYLATGQEKYAEAWVQQTFDYIKKNPLGGNATYPDDKEFAWHPFVVSFRLNHWSNFFNIFLNSPHFTPEFLLTFLNSYNQQAEYVMDHYTSIGNHRLYEAVHLMYGGYAFPELNRASIWYASGMDVLKTEINKQVLPDGVQYELSPSYHIGSIQIFLEAFKITKTIEKGVQFPESYVNLVEKMVLAVSKYSFPDYTFPLYGNAFLRTKESILKNYKYWASVFPDNQTIAYFATDGKLGKKPEQLSTDLPKAGFYAFRNNWDTTAIVMQIKDGPPAYFHSHPDNGTFVLWVKGRNFTPDAGSFVYANLGNQENVKRDWYRSTKAHQTLTLDNQNIENNVTLKKWQTGGDVEILSCVNPSYKNLNHQRTFLFVDKTYFIIVDKAYGEATGQLGIHFNLSETAVPNYDSTKNSVNTQYTDGNNLLIQNLNSNKVEMKKEESFVSYVYQSEQPRPAFVFEKKKDTEKAQIFVTCIYPYTGDKEVPMIKLIENKENDFINGKIDINIFVDGKSKNIKIDIE